MRHWRRSSSAAQSVIAPPLITLVEVDVLNDSQVFVTFNAAVTWNGIGAGTLEIDGNPITWILQSTASKLKGTGAGPFASAQPWAWSGPDASLSPVPLSSQTGLVS